MAKKASRKTLVKKLDTLTSQIVRARTPWCVQCGSPNNLTNGHVFSRRHHSTRFDIREDGNCQTQCWGCNYKHSFDNYEYYEWYKQEFGENKFKKLREEYTTTKKYSNVELEEMIIEYKEILNELL